MALPDDVITLPRLRDALGIPGDDSDGILSTMRAAALNKMEAFTGRVIVTRSAESAPDEFAYDAGVDALHFLMPDIQSTAAITLRYADYEADPGGLRPRSVVYQGTDGALAVDGRGVRIYRDSAESRRWCDAIRFVHPTPTLTATLGMQSADIPASFGEAAALIVRALYDGSAMDRIEAESPLGYLLGPYKGYMDA